MIALLVVAVPRSSLEDLSQGLAQQQAVLVNARAQHQALNAELAAASAAHGAASAALAVERQTLVAPLQASRTVAAEILAAEHRIASLEEELVAVSRRIANSDRGKREAERGLRELESSRQVTYARLVRTQTLQVFNGRFWRGGYFGLDVPVDQDMLTDILDLLVSSQQHQIREFFGGRGLVAFGEAASHAKLALRDRAGEIEGFRASIGRRGEALAADMRKKGVAETVLVQLQGGQDLQAHLSKALDDAVVASFSAVLDAGQLADAFPVKMGPSQQ